MPPVTCMSSFDGMDNEWSGLLSSCAMDTPFLTLQWQKVWWRELGNGEPLCLLRFGGEEEVQGIASLRSYNGDVTFVGDQDVCDYNDFLVPRGGEGPFYKALLEYMSGREWYTLRLYSLSQDSLTLAYLPRLAQAKGYQVDIIQDEVSPRAILPRSWDDYLAGLTKKNRHELRRKLRRLGSADGVRWYALTGVEEIREGMDDFLALLRLSRQSKYRFLTPERESFFRGIARELGAMGLVRLFFMEIGGKRVSSALCFDYGSSRLLYNSGYNPEYGYYSVGLLLKALSLKGAIEEGKAYFDFLRGHESYKYDLGGKDRLLYTMVVTKQ